MLHFMAVWSTERQKLAGARHGFILYIVMAVLLALAILAFALNSFKQGTVTQLARTVDQNRLAILAQSANAELVAKIRSLVNSNPDSDIFTACRSIFTKPDPSASLNSDIHRPCLFYACRRYCQSLSALYGAKRAFSHRL